MLNIKCLIFLILVSNALSGSIVDEDDGDLGSNSNRVHDHVSSFRKNDLDVRKRRHNSNSNRFEKKLSDQEHYIESEHNLDYDNQAFLGKEEADRMKKATPQERLERLKYLYLIICPRL
jgi:hypothetical protein